MGGIMENVTFPSHFHAVEHTPISLSSFTQGSYHLLSVILQYSNVFYTDINHMLLLCVHSFTLPFPTVQVIHFCKAINGAPEEKLSKHMFKLSLNTNC